MPQVAPTGLRWVWGPAYNGVLHPMEDCRGGLRPPAV